MANDDSGENACFAQTFASDPQDILVRRITDEYSDSL